MMNRFQGLGVALATPFRKDASIDFPALSRLVEHVITGGVNYILVMGTTGESVTLNRDEKNAIVRFVIEETDHKVPIIVGIGGNNTHHIISEIRNFSFGHIDGILSVAPYYNKPSQKGLTDHYKAIAAASPVPVILYNVPGRTGVNIQAETTLELAHSTGNIVAIKEASGNLSQIIRIAKDKPEDFLIISGDDALTIPIISVGGSGVISVAANAYPRPFRQIVDAAMAGDFRQAAAIHYRFVELIDLLFADGNPGGIKAVLNEMHLIENNLRLPLVPVGYSVQKRIREVMKGLSV